MDCLEKIIKTPGWTALSGLRLGIGWRLGIAFAAVAALALAANLFAEHEIAIVNTTRIVPVEVPVAVPQTVTAQPAPTPKTPLPPVSRPLDATELVASIEQYAESLRARVVAQSDDSDGRLEEAQRELQTQSETYLAQAKGIAPEAALVDLNLRLEALRMSGTALARDADARQNVLNEFSNHLEALESRVQSAIDRAWKILGRVIARQ